MVEFGGEPIELLPECVGNLEVVALMADHVDERRIARIAEIGLRRAHADGLAALAVQVPPVPPDGRGRDHPHRVGAGNVHILDHDRQIEIAFRFSDEIFKHARAFAFVDLHALGQARTLREGVSVSTASASAVGLPQRSSATMADLNGSPTTASEGQIAFQVAAGPGTRSNAGCSGSSQNS